MSNLIINCGDGQLSTKWWLKAPAFGSQEICMDLVCSYLRSHLQICGES